MRLRRVAASSAVAGACLLTGACSDAAPAAPDHAATSDASPDRAAPTLEPSVAPGPSALPEPSATPSPGDLAYAWPTQKVSELVDPTGWWLEPIPPEENRAIAEEHPRVILVNTWYNVITGSWSRDANGVPSFYHVHEPIPVDPAWPDGSVVVLDADTHEVIESIKVYRTIDEMLNAF